ncbi:DUF3576 domain-containing protein [Gluconobacter japonicus]|uniref:DUF3576 domain-containing protein n=1 Tax=Gluconobacter japonicus TaxID=376620 RepID=A0A9Q2ISP2_GLUJA|nr:DUF3576 domain-containing protein [Gluconobacter japonicus]KXV27417.1 hypothetical protein AD938_07360 [Gluconobacter japonicus]KXV39296.1 hypothetical protein AD942_11105 [Gluconobacter japonicus]KXV45225.1 hypothetical protein AD936_11090 [Gluconobacter japonicus]MBF0871143.1 DUF3576 domain-containing protein [Gluconobacter japonicus]MDI6652555.1 DUF3576 domain-containing protein [Gluconobacter japonicus]
MQVSPVCIHARDGLGPARRTPMMSRTQMTVSRSFHRSAVRVALGMLALGTVAACGGARDPSSLTAPRNHLLGVDRGAEGGADQLKGGVNAYLWRGAIDTLSFMPLASADAVGGVILTDWYQPPASKDERFKIAAYVLDRRMRSDALRVSVFRQVRQDGEWQDTPVSATTTSDITTRILTRARQLRAENGERGN